MPSSVEMILAIFDGVWREGDMAFSRQPRPRNALSVLDLDISDLTVALDAYAFRK